ncbi:MAG: response regulator [Deltaproteobacteria bacterium]|nr:response regulator [Deltaproteobacteria bacterium]
MALLAIALLLVLPGRLDRLARRWSESRPVGIAKVLAPILAVALDFDDRDAAAALLAELESARGAAYAVLLRQDGRPLAGWRQVPLGAPGPGAADRVVHAGGYIHVAVPVEGRSGARGTLVLGFDQTDLEEARTEARLMVTIAALLLLALGVPAAFGVGAVVVGPLLRMTRVAKEIAGGRAGARSQLPVGRSDEVGALAAAFGVMLDRLYEKEAGITALAADLERRVALRTAELALANQELSRRLAELTTAQEKLIAADRRTSVGRLAAGVAHEINNPLAYIDANLGYLEGALRELQAAVATSGSSKLGPAVQEMAEAVAESRQGAGRVRHIVRGLKTFSGNAQEEVDAASVRSALEAAIDMARSEVQKRAQLVTRIGELPKVHGNEVRLSQVFLNLLMNAAQAIPAGDAEGNEVRVTAATGADGRAIVEVTDTGAGIPPEVQARLFEPFFTTKPTGEGTGLGLSISRGIVERCGGTISVESTPGQGATFRVILPPSAPVATPPPDATARRAAVVRRRLLVVDDEPLICKAILRGLGRDHEVVTESDPRAALRRIEAGESFDAILCDVMMPGLTGIQLREELEARHPGAAASVVLMTASVVSESGQKLLASGDVPWLQKPIDLERLRRILDGKP